MRKQTGLVGFRTAGAATLSAATANGMFHSVSTPRCVWRTDVADPSHVLRQSGSRLGVCVEDERLGLVVKHAAEGDFDRALYRDFAARIVIRGGTLAAVLCRYAARRNPLAKRRGPCRG